MSEQACEMLENKLAALDDISSFNKKYGVNKTSPLIFAMGDGNHSLATAKAYYENLKKQIGEEAKNSPARFALCELVNLHDSSLEFEAIHRVIFGADSNEFLEQLGNEYDISLDRNATGQKFVLVCEGEEKTVSGSVNDMDEEVSVVWETNGAVEPHRIWIYPDGKKPEDGLQLNVDSFGAVKVLAGDGRESD